VTGQSFADRLVAAGLDDVERERKAGLFDVVLDGFGRISRANPDMVCWVPGRLEVFGTHTDYAGGRTLVAALPRGFVLVLGRREDAILLVMDAADGESVTLDTKKLKGNIPGWRHYVEVVVERLTRNFPGAQLGANIVFGSDLPRAAGMSSSSALIVGIASTLVRLSGITDRDEWRRHVRDRLDEAGYYACIENGRSFGTLEGHQGVGTHGGSEDHAAMLCGTAACVTGFAFVPMRKLDTLRVPDGWQFVIASSGIAAEKTGAALTSYNRLAHGAGILLDLWNTHEAPAASLASAMASSPYAARQLRTCIERSQADGWPRDALAARLEHFLREDARVADACSAFGDMNANLIAQLAASSQSDSEQLLANQVPETAGLVQLALEKGALAARSFGAGFGGSVWALVTRERASAFCDEWLLRYRQEFPSPQRPVVFLGSPGPATTYFHG
jgi:galactokinase